jgi:hypothetical protein
MHLLHLLLLLLLLSQQGSQSSAMLSRRTSFQGQTQGSSRNQ